MKFSNSRNSDLTDNLNELQKIKEDIFNRQDDMRQTLAEFLHNEYSKCSWFNPICQIPLYFATIEVNRKLDEFEKEAVEEYSTA